LATTARAVCRVGPDTWHHEMLRTPRDRLSTPQLIEHPVERTDGHRQVSSPPRVHRGTREVRGEPPAVVEGHHQSSEPCQIIVGRRISLRSKPHGLAKARSSSSQPSTPTSCPLGDWRPCLPNSSVRTARSTSGRRVAIDVTRPRRSHSELLPGILEVAEGSSPRSQLRTLRRCPRHACHPIEPFCAVGRHPR